MRWYLKRCVFRLQDASMSQMQQGESWIHRSKQCVAFISLMSNGHLAPWFMKQALFAAFQGASYYEQRATDGGLLISEATNISTESCAYHQARHSIAKGKGQILLYFVCCLVACYDVHVLNCQGTWHLD